MAMKIKPAGKVAILLILLGVIAGGYQIATRGGGGLGSLIPQKQATESIVPTAGELGSRRDIGGSGTKAQMPGIQPARSDKPEIRYLLWAWNAQMGLMFANGGPRTTQGSFMDRNGVNINLIRQDDPAKMQEALVAFAQELKNGSSQPSKGAHFVAIMGDGAAAFLAGVNPILEKLGPEYRAKVVGSAGFSYGEDKFMGPPAWRENPQASKGGVVSGYLRDGDWNIAQKWLADNGLKNNPDETTYDPDALNWVSADSYIDAAEKYITGYSEERPVVRNGKRTGEKKRISVQATVTWTPGDVSVARKKGGLVSIVSTREYSGQMPNTIIGIDRWMRDNRGQVESMLKGVMQGGDAVKSDPAALSKAAEISAQVYNEEDAAYWEKYYKGVREQDKQGLMVELGGSYVNNIQDNMLLFGLAPGSTNLFAATYTVFGDIVKQQYPNLVPSYPPVTQILDTSFIKNVATSLNYKASEAGSTGTGIVRPDPRAVATRDVVSRKVWRINFETGRATFTAQTRAVLERLLRESAIAGNTRIEIQGHTDNVGDAEANRNLSEMRAFAVKNWLEKQAPANFRGRLSVQAIGETQPLVPNTSEANRAQNRRVEIIVVGVR
jgi:OmpA-OmpF porin, OOP family